VGTITQERRVLMDLEAIIGWALLLVVPLAIMGTLLAELMPDRDKRR
jgi:hypothetical protein